MKIKCQISRNKHVTFNEVLLVGSNLEKLKLEIYFIIFIDIMYRLNQGFNNNKIWKNIL